MLRKRKAAPTNSGQDEDLSESIKRCRINTTPGQLRLQSDVHELLASGSEDVCVEKTEDVMRVMIHFKDNGLSPNVFSYTVPKFYPHQRPLIKCIDNGWGDSVFITDAGMVVHEQLQAGWTGVHSLSFAVDILREIRINITRGTNDMEYERTF